VQRRKCADGASKVPVQRRILFRQVRKSGVVGSRPRVQTGDRPFDVCGAS